MSIRDTTPDPEFAPLECRWGIDRRMGTTRSDGVAA